MNNSQKDKFLCQKNWKLDIVLETIVQMWNQEDMKEIKGESDDTKRDKKNKKVEENEDKNESKDATKVESDKESDKERSENENKNKEQALNHRKILLQSHLQYQLSNILLIPLPKTPTKTYGADFIVIKSKILV